MPNLYIKRDAGTGIESGINLCGQALKNYKTLLPNPVPLNKVGMWRNNEFDFIKDNFDEAILVDKTISISTNGDVYAGCSAPWNLISEIKLFNINDYNGDFYTQIENFCWAHPVNDGIHNVRKKYFVYNWLIDHGYQIEDCPADYAECLNYLISTADAHEKIALHLHSLHPFINHYDIDTITTCRILQSFLENDIPPAVIQGYIDCCTKFTQEAAEELSTEQLKYYAEKTFLKYLRI